jgi:nucleoside-diphosphate-sugar epimerase
MLYDKILNDSVLYCTNHSRDFTHVDDVVNAIVMLMNTDIVGVVDVGTSNPVSVQQLLISANIHTPLIDVDHEQEETCADPIELFDLGWRPTKDIFEELKNDLVRKAALEEHTKHG